MVRNLKFGLLVVLCFLAACLTPKNQPPIFVSGPGPIYPSEAKRDGVEGYVVLIYDVTAAGQVENIRVESAEPLEVFDQAAIDAVLAWQFRPPKVDGVAHSFLNVRSKVGFRLGETDYK